MVEGYLGAGRENSEVRDFFPLYYLFWSLIMQICNFGAYTFCTNVFVLILIPLFKLQQCQAIQNRSINKNQKRLIDKVQNLVDESRK